MNHRTHITTGTEKGARTIADNSNLISGIITGGWSRCSEDFYDSHTGRLGTDPITKEHAPTS